MLPLCIFFLLPTLVASLTFYVAPSPLGNDKNSGTSASTPFATLHHAQLAMRAALNSSEVFSYDPEVVVAPGTYIEANPLVFLPVDSGPPGFTVRWECTGATLYVGTQIQPALFTSVPGSPGVYVANVTSLAPPPPPTPPTPAGCGLVEPGYSYNGYDITTVWVGTNNVSGCCEACASQAGCHYWSLCVDIVCGTPEKPINCYLKTSDAGRSFFGPLRTSGSLQQVAPPPWRFFTLTEGDRAATIARVPNRGSGYLANIDVGNSDSSFSWPAGSPDFPTANATPIDITNAHVFCNIGAFWFTETRPATSVDMAARTVFFEGRSNGVAGCNDKAYFQGPVEFLDEPGEWAYIPATGLLYYWPYDPASLSPTSTTPIVAATSPTSIEFKGSSGGAWVHDIEVVGLQIIGSGFTPDGAYRVFPPGRPNDFPSPTDSGMVRMEGVTRITLTSCKLLHAGLSAVWLSREATNVTIQGCWMEGAGFCGVTASGVYPGDPPYTSAEASYVNFGHTIHSNLMYNLGVRVGHGAGVWLFQSGANTITNNYIKEVPRNGVGMYGLRFGAGGGFGSGVLPSSAYNLTLDFFSALDLLTTRNNLVAYNLLENVVRDSCDAGGFETWGVGVGNVFHTNALSDCDSGGIDGSWMNFLFQDDASNWLNHSSNLVFNVAGKGSEEGGMIKSIYSVSENNVFAFSKLGHLMNIQPYIEPAAAMTFSRNIFAYVVSGEGAGSPLDISLNPYTSSTLNGSSSLMTDPATAAIYNFTATTNPALTTPVILEFDFNVYWNCSHNSTPLPTPTGPWDTHSLAVDPLFVGTSTPPWQRTVLDLELAPNSPALAIPGFRPIDVHAIGLTPTFAFDLGTFGRRIPGRDKVQAETYDRMQGLWREGSFGISPGGQGWGFDPGAWALYRRVDITTAPATTFKARITPFTEKLTLGLALGSPDNVIATLSAQTAGAPIGVMRVYSVSLVSPLSVVGGDVFLLPSEGCIIDWFQLV